MTSQERNEENAEMRERLIEQGVPESALPLHKKLIRTRPVVFVRSFFGNLLSMVPLSFILVFYTILYYNPEVEDLLDQFNQNVINTLGFVFPEYYVDLEDIRLDFSADRDGWVSVDKVTLLDAVKGRSITIDQIRMAPSFGSLFLGNAKFHHLNVYDVSIDYTLDAPKQNSRLVFPISALDIPAEILRKNGEIEINDMILRLVNSQNTELFSVRDFNANLVRTNDGYTTRISARQTDTQSGSFVFNIERKYEEILFDGFSRNYRVSPNSEFDLDFDLNLGFENVPEYDFTEASDNATEPYRFLESGSGFVRIESPSILAEAQYNYDQDIDALSIANMKLDIGQQKFRGNVDVTLGDAVYAHGHDFGAQYEGVDGPVNFTGGSFFARIDVPEQRVEIGEISFANQYFHIYGNGRARLQPNPTFALDAEVADLDYDNLINLWPKDIAMEPYELVKNRLDFDELKGTKVWVRFNEELKVQADVVATNLGVKPVDYIPFIRAPSATVKLTNKNFLLQAKKAEFENFEDALEFEDVELWIDDFAKSPPSAQIGFDARGDASALFESLKEQPIALEQRTTIEAARVSGEFNARFDMDVPLAEGVQLNDIQLAANGEFKNAHIKNMLSGDDVGIPYAKINMTQNGLDMDGQVTWNGFPADVTLDQKFSPGSRPTLGVDVVVTNKLIERYSPTVVKYADFGRLPTHAEVQFLPNGRVSFEADIDAKDFSFSYPAIGQVKTRGVPGHAVARGEYANNAISFVDFDVNLTKFQTHGRWSPAEGAHFQDLHLENYYDGEGFLKDNVVIMKNATVDFRNVKLGDSDSSGRPWIVKLENVRANLYGDIYSTNTNGYFQTGTQPNGEFTGLIGGTGRLNARVWSQNGVNFGQLSSRDAGEVLRGANLFEDMRGGLFDMRAKMLRGQKMVAGKLNINNFAVENEGVAFRLLQAGSVFGALEGNRLSFSNLNGDVVVNRDSMNLYSGYAYGPSLGVSIGGTYGVKNKNADFFGVLTPAYLLNGVFQNIPIIGPLVGGNEGEGLFGVTYRIHGTPQTLSITANPLSLLTPGRLRQLWGNVPQAAKLPPEYRIEE